MYTYVCHTAANSMHGFCICDGLLYNVIVNKIITLQNEQGTQPLEKLLQSDDFQNIRKFSYYF